MKLQVSSKEVVKIRHEKDCSLQEAYSLLIKEKLLNSVKGAKTFEDIKDAIVFIINNSNITFNGHITL